MTAIKDIVQNTSTRSIYNNLLFWAHKTKTEKLQKYKLSRHQSNITGL